MSIKTLLLVTIFGFSCATELTGERKSIIPRHASEKDVLFHVAEPTEGLYKRSNLGKTFDSGVLHKLEDFLLKKAKDFEIANKKSEIEDQKEVETIAESIETTPSASGSSGGGKIADKRGGKDQHGQNGGLLTENQKKTIVTKQNEVKQGDKNDKAANTNAEHKGDLLSNLDDSLKKTSKEQLQEQQSKAKSKNDDNEQRQEKANKTVKKDDVVAKDKPATSHVLQTRKVKKVVNDNATKRDKTVPDEDDEYGSSPWNPALSCTDLFTKFPNLPSGSYWVQSADRKEKMLVMCENSIDQKEGACLECQHDEDAEKPGKEWKPSKSVKADEPEAPIRLGAKKPAPIIHPVVGDHLKMEDDPNMDQGPDDPDQIKDGMWPYESVTKILPEEATKNVTDLKLPPLPGPQPSAPASEPNQALQSHSPDANSSTTNTEKSKNDTSKADNSSKNVTSSSKNATSVSPSNSGSNSSGTAGANKTQGAKEDNTASLNSTSTNSKGNSTSATTENKPSNKNQSDSKVQQVGNANKTESKNEKPETQNKTANSGDKSEEKVKNTVKIEGESNDPGAGVGKLVDPAKPKNESVVPNVEMPATLGPKESQKPDKNDAASKVSEDPLAKVSENTPAQLPAPGSTPQEIASIKKPEQGTNGMKTEPPVVGSGTAQEKPKQEDSHAPQQPVQNTAAAEAQKPGVTSAQAQNTPVTDAKNSPVAVNLPVGKPLTNDQLSQYQPSPGKGLAQSNPMPNEQQVQSKPSPGGTLVQNVPAGNNPPPNLAAQNVPMEAGIMQQGKPADNAVTVQNKPLEGGVAQQGKPADNAVTVQNKPLEGGIAQQGKPAENAVTVQNKPLEGGIAQQSRLVENVVESQNKPAQTPAAVQGSTIQNPLLVETKQAGSPIVVQNKPADSAIVAQNQPAGSAKVAQGKPATANNAAQMNKAAENDLSFDLFGDDASPVNAPPNENQDKNAPQGQATVGNVKPQAQNAEQEIASVPGSEIEGAGTATAQNPAAAQNPPLTHEKMIELSSPPILDIGHTNFATEKDLHLPFKNAKTEGVNRPMKIANQFVGKQGNQGEPGTTAMPDNFKQSMQKVSENVPPTVASITKGATPLKPTQSIKKGPQTLEEFETERLRSQGLPTTMEEGQLKSWPKLSNDGKQPIGQQGGNSPSWEDDFGLLGDATWVRDKAPEAPESSNKKGKAKEESKGKKNEEAKEKPEKDVKDKKDEKADAEKGKKEEGNKDKSEKVVNMKSGADKEKGKEENSEGKMEYQNNAKKNTTESAGGKTERQNDEEKIKKGDSSKEAKEDDQLKKPKKIDEDKSKDEKTEKSEGSIKDEKNKSSNETDNVLHSKASYQYIENKTTPLDNFEYHEALGKGNETSDNVAKSNKTNAEPEPIQAQNVVPGYNKNKTLGGFPATQQNVHPASTDPVNSPAVTGSPQMTTAGDVHQISSATPIGSALPLAALPLANQDHPQFFVSSPVSNQSTTTTTTSLLPVDPITGDHVLNTSLALVAVHGDEGAIPESALVGTDQVDWMKKYVPSKKNMAGEMKSFVSLQKAPQSIEYSIDAIGKKKSELRPKSLVPVGEKVSIKRIAQKSVKDIRNFVGNHETSIKRKRNTFNKLQKALEGTNVTIENGVSSHMTFKSFVPRLSFDDIVDEQKRSSIPSKSARQVQIEAKRSWEKSLGNVIGALDGTNFSIENGVASQMTFKSNIEPVSLIKPNKLQKSLADIDSEIRNEGVAQGRKTKQMDSHSGLMQNKSGKMSNKLIGKKKPEKVPFKTRKTLEDEKMKEKASKHEAKAKNKRPDKLKSRVKAVEKFPGKKTREPATRPKVKRSKIGLSQLHNTIGSHRVPLKGANHSEANLVSTFSGAKNAKESKSVTITNVDKALVDNATNENGTINVKAEEGIKTNGTKADKGSEKIDQSENKASKNESVAKLGSSSKGGAEDGSSVEDKNTTKAKAPERGVFEPDIGTIKKMPETTDIKHHIVGSGDVSNHTSSGEGSPELLLKGNLSEHKIVDNNTLHAIFNVRKIDEESIGNLTHLHLKNIEEYKINENSTLSVVYNMQPLENKGANSTSKVLAEDPEGQHINKNDTLKAVQGGQRATKKEKIDVYKVQDKAMTTSKGKHGTKNKTWKLQQRPTKANGLIKKQKGRKGSLRKAEKQQIVQSKSKKGDTKEAKAKTSAKNAKKIAVRTKKKSIGSKETKKGSAKGFPSVNSKNDSLDFMQVAIKSKDSKTTKPKKLKHIGMVLEKEDRKPGRGKSKHGKTADDMKKKLKNKGDENLNAKEVDTEIKEKKATHKKEKHNQRNKHKQNESKAKGKGEKELKTEFEKNKAAIIGNNKVNKLRKNMKSKMEARIKNEKKYRKKAVEQFNKTLQKIRRIATNPTRNPVEKQKKKKAKKNEKRKGATKKVQNDEERLKEIQKRKKVRTIFFPQIFMKKNLVPKTPGHDVEIAKVRQLIPTQVGNIEPSNGAMQNVATGHEQGSKNSDKPIAGKENGKKAEAGSALYENDSKASGVANKSGNMTEEKGSKNSAEATEDIDKVLNLTVGFLNKTFHDHFGKEAHGKDKVNGTTDNVGQNVTNEWKNSMQNGSNNGTTGGQNTTSPNGTSNIESTKNGTNNGTSTVTSGPNLAGNASLQNNTGDTNLTMGNAGFNQSEFSKQNLTNQLGNNTSKPSNMSSGFRSERIPGVSKAAAVSDMMSPIENYILNMINETGQQRFGNQSTPEGKRGSTNSNETKATGMEGLAALLSKGGGNLNLKSNQVSIRVTPKKNTSSDGKVTDMKAGAGMMLNFASKRSKLNKVKDKSKQNGKWTGRKKSYQDKPTKAIKGSNKTSSKPTDNKPTTSNRLQRKKHKPSAKKTQANATTKTGIKFATTHKMQKVNTFSKGAVTFGFTKEISNAKKPSQSAMGAKGKLGKNAKLKDKLPRLSAKEDKEKDAEVPKSPKKSTNEEKKDTKKQKKSNRTKRQNEKENSNSDTNNNGSAWQIQIDGQKIDWGPLSENWPNFGSG